jgi:hypothetical protein
MRTRLVGLATALTAATLLAGCGLTGSEPAERPEKSGRITLADKTLDTELISCSQIDWLLSIEASAAPGRAQASLELGGDRPIVKTVSIENIDGLQGTVGGDVGKAEASIVDGTYTITGTAVVSKAAEPGQTTTAPFRIEAPC